MTNPASGIPPFHLAIPVHDIEAARHFYGEVLGFGAGRSDTRWTDWNVEGHQVVTHQVDGHVNAVAGTNPVDGHDVPVPHFGLVLDVERFQELAAAAHRRRDRFRDRALRTVRGRARRAVDDVLPRPLRATRWSSRPSGTCRSSSRSDLRDGHGDRPSPPT